jgi:hypothetical protein
VNTFDKHLIRFLIVSVCYFELPIRPAHSELAPAYSITGASQAESARQRLEQFLEREDVRAGLEKNGVNPAAAKARVDALSDEEVAAIASRIEALPADGEIIGALVFVFVLLLVTDILGYTRIYSFTRSVRK